MIDGNMELICVDDVLIACNNDHIIQSINQLIATYKMKDMGEMDWYIGIRCKHNKSNNSFTLNQTKYIQDVLTKFDVMSTGGSI
jgi:hypothetical protein